jgi:hypothetical protein
MSTGLGFIGKEGYSFRARDAAAAERNGARRRSRRQSTFL